MWTLEIIFDRQKSKAKETPAVLENPRYNVRLVLSEQSNAFFMKTTVTRGTQNSWQYNGNYNKLEATYIYEQE